MNETIELCQDCFPWISSQATRLGLETRDARFARLGGELFILSQQLQSADIATRIGPNLSKIAEIVGKACSLERATPIRRTHSLDALREILKYRNTNTPEKTKIIANLRHSLPIFVRKNPEYHVVLSLITDCLRVADSPDPTDEHTLQSKTDSKYPVQVVNTLYTHLRLYSTCSCSSPHLDYARLRLDAGRYEERYSEVPFELLFTASPPRTSNADCSLRWREARVWVAKHTQPSKRKKVAFTTQIANPMSRPGSNQLSPEVFKRVQLGEFCTLIRSDDNTQIQFRIHDNAMSFAPSSAGTLGRNFLPDAGISLSEWLERTTYLSNRVKITLAYTIARAVWQYYNSDWMEAPWTHDKIQILKERANDNNHLRPHPYFITKLCKHEGKVQDYHESDHLLHMYPNILALAIVLIEIAIKKSFHTDTPLSFRDATNINDYYEWAWMTANSSNLRKTVGAVYEKVVNNCLDGELFRDAPIDESKHDKNLDMRQSIVYDKIVLPLRELYHAYIDDWDIPDIPTDGPPQLTQPSFSASNPRLTVVPRRKLPSIADFQVAIFCALPLEAGAVAEMFEELWSDEELNLEKSVGDNNTYSMGRVSRHNVVIVHMPGIGKGAASQAASSLRSSYPGVRLALVVGICGGVPSLNADNGDELILGDVVISDGIVQYDFGRQFPDGFSSKTGPGVVGPPPIGIRSMLAKLKVERNQRRLEAKLSHYLDILQEADGLNRASYPGVDKDELYDPSYHHKHRHISTSSCISCAKHDAGCDEARKSTCQSVGCEKNMLVPRNRLQQVSPTNSHPTLAPKPRIHFGMVGSGDTVMKSGLHRDRTAAQHGIIAFEMEAAGVWDTLPCLVIKGVCDYADSHKNKDWQNYAAASAAACLKAVLDEYTNIN
ncbi:hypothetical protein BJX64DRAFT_288291 [Aspergillus heterothallicus]